MITKVVPESITASIGELSCGSNIIFYPYMNPYASTPQNKVGLSSLDAKGI
jgi:hypothetical protein